MLIILPGLVPKGLLYEAEQDLVGLPGLLGLGGVEHSRHVAQLVREQGRLPTLKYQTKMLAFNNHLDPGAINSANSDSDPTWTQKTFKIQQTKNKKIN